VVVNGRISARSYPRYRMGRPIFKRVFALVDHFCVQGEESKTRLIDLGAPAERISVTGSLKFDSLDGDGIAGRGADRVLRVFRGAEGRPVLVAGSTFPGEDEIVLRSFERIRTLTRNALLIVAPRRPERFGEVEALAKSFGFRTVRRTELTMDQDLRADVVVLDTIGELAALYELAAVAFVGGSLVPTGGHNPIEPARHGVPVLTGPHISNFLTIYEQFIGCGAARVVRDEASLAAAVLELTGEPEVARAAGAAGRALLERHAGATRRTADALERFLA
jgi:3-deoxy-D-manno-octulosonic-acid transferase